MHVWFFFYPLRPFVRVQDKRAFDIWFIMLRERKGDGDRERVWLYIVPKYLNLISFRKGLTNLLAFFLKRPKLNILEQHQSGSKSCIRLIIFTLIKLS